MILPVYWPTHLPLNKGEKCVTIPPKQKRKKLKGYQKGKRK